MTYAKLFEIEQFNHLTLGKQINDLMFNWIVGNFLPFNTSYFSEN